MSTTYTAYSTSTSPRQATEMLGPPHPHLPGAVIPTLEGALRMNILTPAHLRRYEWRHALEGERWDGEQPSLRKPGLFRYARPPAGSRVSLRPAPPSRGAAEPEFPVSWCNSDGRAYERYVRAWLLARPGKCSVCGGRAGPVECARRGAFFAAKRLFHKEG